MALTTPLLMKVSRDFPVIISAKSFRLQGMLSSSSRLRSKTRRAFRSWRSSEGWFLTDEIIFTINYIKIFTNQISAFLLLTVSPVFG